MNDDHVELARSVEKPVVIDDAKKKRLIIRSLIVYSALLGIVCCFLPEGDRALEFIAGLPFLILGISWCITDANERHHRIGRVTKLVLILCFIVGFPLYLLQTRGFGAFKTLGWTLLLGGGMVLCEYTTAYATIFIGDVVGLWDAAQ